MKALVSDIFEIQCAHGKQPDWIASAAADGVIRFFDAPPRVELHRDGFAVIAWLADSLVWDDDGLRVCRPGER